MPSRGSACDLSKPDAERLGRHVCVCLSVHVGTGVSWRRSKLVWTGLDLGRGAASSDRISTAQGVRAVCPTAETASEVQLWYLGWTEKEVYSIRETRGGNPDLRVITAGVRM